MDDVSDSWDVFEAEPDEGVSLSAALDGEADADDETPVPIGVFWRLLF